ncbi:MAG TPA: tRNA (adenosine(37)-N6)-threonylcarbamoyltransferase complex ATPase subunit type 1 TsaE [Ferruginibacter sp.]|nr:tRNA (adenosine(37)-N6)-threonylcarbamoyltransferase complex ATPase subunit type 1 TsaE [Ferruginibacter sp.]HMX79290.1 tRNA (adenosine(37)-N6)-threonylcarbamoyltransferase complex ATPase subunit type 1 TsaE [Ferruginibacter sp.]HNF02062.1 tRNA (adenosine(37)-N6)-threonylcarbamoyltransferase complex ATPase subunit type 1 TsaE [Ferruginibacter sp.]HNG63274.1 tRNA (adenosine(37)-N6)-threonylcarbamoyltransferase complex ATPase subunit type 1 TsaE [Ferruginibacter sp.]HNJ28110.1 tRNA (adenosine(
MEVNFTLEQIDAVAAQVLAASAAYPVLAFHGEMGAGKTTLIHTLCEKMGVKDTVSSPTFSIINQYKKGDGGTVYHMDLYRIRDEQEAINAGVEDCLYSGHTCLVEWPEKVPGIFPPDTLHIYIETVPGNTRNLRINL